MVDMMVLLIDKRMEVWLMEIAERFFLLVLRCSYDLFDMRFVMVEVVKELEVLFLDKEGKMEMKLFFLVLLILFLNVIRDFYELVSFLGSDFSSGVVFSIVFC